MKFSGYLADAVVVLHFVFVAVVVVGLLATLLGAALRWRWVRNFWFRVVNLGLISVVAVETMIGVSCPLTTLENKLRQLAGETVTEGWFLSRMLYDLLSFDVESWIVSALEIGGAVLILAVFLLVPPRWPSKQPRD
jgi:Flp pilus assembly pilin Flp